MIWHRLTLQKLRLRSDKRWWGTTICGKEIAADADISRSVIAEGDPPHAHCARCFKTEPREVGEPTPYGDALWGPPIECESLDVFQGPMPIIEIASYIMTRPPLTIPQEDAQQGP